MLWGLQYTHRPRTIIVMLMLLKPGVETLPPHCVLHMGAVEGGKIMFRGVLQMEGPGWKKGRAWRGLRAMRTLFGTLGEEAGRMEGLRTCCHGDFTSGGFGGRRSNMGCWSQSCQAIERSWVLGIFLWVCTLVWRAPKRPVSSPCYSFKLFRTGLLQIMHVSPGWFGIKYSWCKETKTRRKHHRTVNIDWRISFFFFWGQGDKLLLLLKSCQLYRRSLCVCVFRF